MAKSDRNMGKLPADAAELLARLANGETIVEIAAAWGVSPRSVYRMAAQARVALGARTNREAMVKYARNGYQQDSSCTMTLERAKLQDRLKAQREYLEVAGWHDV